MGPIVINGEPWRVAWVRPGDPRLTDRTGTERLATTDPRTRTIFLMAGLVPPILDRVLIHEIAHAITVSWGLLHDLGRMVSERDGIGVEEWSARLMESHAIEAVHLAATALGRSVCVSGRCVPW